MAELRPFAREAVPTLRDVSALVRTAGDHNDLIDLAKTVKPLRDVTVGPVHRNGKERPGSLEQGRRAFTGSRPQIGFFRPYAVDFTGWLDDFSHSGIYDANGSASRVATSINAFAAVGAQLRFVPPRLRDALGNAVTRSRQNNRCPGAMERPWNDGSNPWKAENLSCDPGQLPPGR